MTSPRSGATIPTGAHPGNTGGKRGRSGRKPLWFTDFCRLLIEQPRAKQPAAERALQAILQDPDHPHFVGVLKIVAGYAYGLPKQQIAVSNADHYHYDLKLLKDAELEQLEVIFRRSAVPSGSSRP